MDVSFRTQISLIPLHARALQTSNEHDDKMPFSMPVPPVPARRAMDGENSSFYGSLRLNLALFENIQDEKQKHKHTFFTFRVFIQ